MSITSLETLNKITVLELEEELKEVIQDRLDREEKEEYSWDDEQKIKDILEELREQVKSFVKPEHPRVKIKQFTPLKEIMDKLYDRVIASNQTSFNTFSKLDDHSREERIVHFLALLELVKQGILIVKQTELFGDIAMELGEIKTPNYGSDV